MARWLPGQAIHSANEAMPYYRRGRRLYHICPSALQQFFIAACLRTMHDLHASIARASSQTAFMSL